MKEYFDFYARQLTASIVISLIIILILIIMKVIQFYIESNTILYTLAFLLEKIGVIGLSLLPLLFYAFC